MHHDNSNVLNETFQQTSFPKKVLTKFPSSCM